MGTSYAHHRGSKRSGLTTYRSPALGYRSGGPSRWYRATVAEQSPGSCVCERALTA